ASAEQSNIATKQIAETIQSVAVGMDQQVRNVDDTSKTLHEMSAGIQQIAVNTQNLSTVSVDTAEKANEGGKSIQTAVDQMQSINETFDSLSESIKELGSR